ncbi:alpha-2-macroglobulin family protein [Altericista sp. CCNU0014]|uniref:alpha-2-macroglobulin family protein n=1 Tax=Altericista sp. CCNU0014 TaxID=3082949 RepID=UPI00384CCFDF
MRFFRRVLKTWRFLVVGLVIGVAIAACTQLDLGTKTAPLPAVAALPNPKLPDWIEQISPLGQTDPLAQIRIRFKEPLIPLEQLESESQQTLLQRFELTPALPGQFRFLTPRMVGFQAEQALPQATRVKVNLKAGLADLKQHKLAQDLAWTFNTAPIQLTNLPGKTDTNAAEPEPIGLNPKLEITSNTELDLTSLGQQASLIPEGKQQRVALQAFLKDADAAQTEREEATPAELFNPAERDWVYVLTPKIPLDKSTSYRLEVATGLRSARGNLASETPFKSELKTYGPLAFQRLTFEGQPDSGGAYGRFVRGAPQLQFNNGLVADSVKANITASPPPPKDAPLARAYDGDRTVSLNPWAFEPNATYAISLGADLKDKFDQTLGKPVTVTYQSGDVAPDLWAPTNLNIFPASTDLQLNLSAVNLPDGTYQAAYRVVQPTDLIYSESANPDGDGPDLLPPPKDWSRFKIPNPTQNKAQELAIPLREKLGAETGMLAYGIKARTNQYKDLDREKWREPTYYGLVQLTNLGVFAQWFPQSGLVRVHHLSDGSAAKAATVEVYPSLVGKAARGDRPCATGITDQTGTLTLGLEALQQCMEGKDGFAEAPNLLAIAREQKDWAFVRVLDYSGYDYGIDPGWNGAKPESRGTIFSDRKLYQPGETAWFTGAAYYLRQGVLQQDKKVPYQITLEDPNGRKTDLGSQTTDEFGTFAVKAELAATQPLGYYKIQAKAANGVEITGDFRVAEFKPPNFKVDLTLDGDFATPDRTITATAQSNYLFGPPVSGGKLNYYVTRQPATFTPKGWDKFTFGPQWFWPEEQPTVTSDVLQNSTALTPQGQGTQAIAVAEDLPFAMTYRVDAEVKDVSNLSVADSQTFTALPSDRLIGLKHDFVADAGKPFPIEVIVTDPAGTAISGDRVRVELQQMTYSSVTQVVEGSRTAKDQVEYATVDRAELASATAPQTVRLTPKESGSYRIRANFTNAKDSRTATDQRIWATGSEPVFWGSRYTNNRLELRLDKDRYQPGDTATVLIQSPYPEAELYLSVVRHKVLYQSITTIKGGAPQVRFPISAEMLPNAAVEAVLVRRGQRLSEVEPGNLKDLVRMGFAPFDLDLDAKTLSVAIAPTQPTVLPQAEQTVNLTLKDLQGQPVKGQFAVVVVNESVLQLTGYRIPNLVETVYAKQDISTRFNDNRGDVVLEPLVSPLQKGWGFGGGFAAGAGSTRIRTDFRALAYYNGSVLTDDRGQASVTFKLPDDLTTWRVMAVATDGNLRFGNNDVTFITTKPLISNPVLPPFARPGDRFEAGLSVTNTTGQAGTLDIQGTLDGAAQFESEAKLQPPAPTTTQAYRLPILATQPGTARIQFATKLGSNADAFAVPLEVKPYAAIEQVVESGTTTAQVKIPLNIGNNVDPKAGGLEISLASTLIPELTAPAKQVLQEEQLPFLEPAASQLAIAAQIKTLSQRYGQAFQDFNPVEQANLALTRLQKLQTPDGGFAPWPGRETSDPFISPYAAQSLAQAQAAELPVQPGTIAAVKGYLNKLLANPSQSDLCKEDLCKAQIRLEALLALAEFGDRRNTFVSDIYALRAQFDPTTQLKLARLLSRLPDWNTEATTLAQQLQASLYQTGRTATLNLPQSWRWMSSPTAAQAEALRLLVERKDSTELQDRALQGLLSLRREGTWGSTYDNARAFAALVSYSKQQPAPPQFAAIAQLANKTLMSQTFAGFQKTSIDRAVPMAELPRGKRDLVLKKTGKGTLHYLAAYRYQPQGDRPGRFNGLRVTRTVRPANQNKVLQRVGLTPPSQPLSLNVGEVFDIGLEIIADRPVDRVVITDPLPAGLEAVDTSFQTSTPYFQSKGDRWQIDYQTIYKDKIVAYGDRLEAGVYTVRYLVRSVTPGTFQWPGAEVHLQYAPEEFGRSSYSQLKTVDRVN